MSERQRGREAKEMYIYKSAQEKEKRDISAGEAPSPGQEVAQAGVAAPQRRGEVQREVHAVRRWQEAGRRQGRGKEESEALEAA